jgi:hypothetical protein
MNEYRLSRGAHDTPDKGRCVMEWAAWVAGEPHSDRPVCVDPVIGEFLRTWNDELDEETRQRLRPYAARAIGTADDGRSLERSFMCFDWLVRVHTPAWLELAGLAEHANALRGLPPIVDREGVRRADPLVRAAGAAAGDAIRAAAGDAAGTAAEATAWATAWAAAGDAAWDAARAAAHKPLAPTVRMLQESAFGLLDRMLPGEILTLPTDVAERAAAVSHA